MAHIISLNLQANHTQVLANLKLIFPNNGLVSAHIAFLEQFEQFIEKDYNDSLAKYDTDTVLIAMLPHITHSDIEDHGNSNDSELHDLFMTTYQRIKAHLLSHNL